jgi:hypothetical protein
MATISPAWGTPEWVQQHIDAYGFPPLAGGAPDDDDDAKQTEDEKTAEDATADTDDDAGKSDDESTDADIDWKAMARKHEREAKKARKENADAQAKLAAKDEAAKSDQEKAIDKARKEAAEEAKGETSKQYRTKIKNAEIRAAAAGKFADPGDAVALLKLDDEDIFDDEGEINADAIKVALDELLESKPHLAAGQGTGRV